MSEPPIDFATILPIPTAGLLVADNQLHDDFSELLIELQAGGTPTPALPTVTLIANAPVNLPIPSRPVLTFDGQIHDDLSVIAANQYVGAGGFTRASSSEPIGNSLSTFMANSTSGEFYDVATILAEGLFNSSSGAPDFGAPYLEAIANGTDLGTLIADVHDIATVYLPSVLTSLGDISSALRYSFPNTVNKSGLTLARGAQVPLATLLAEALYGMYPYQCITASPDVFSTAIFPIINTLLCPMFVRAQDSSGFSASDICANPYTFRDGPCNNRGSVTFIPAPSGIAGAPSIAGIAGLASGPFNRVAAASDLTLRASLYTSVPAAVGSRS